MDKLLAKYNVAAPRYTSYPTMPYWDLESFTVNGWENAMVRSFNESNTTDGISIYVHLPYCESLCTYCGCNTRITKNHSVEEPYIDALLKEWAMYLEMMEVKPTIREIHLGGGTPTFFSAGSLQRLITGLLQKANIHPEADFSFEAHPANTTIQHLQILYDLGFRRLSLGIQDFDERVQHIINRHQSFEQVYEVTANARAIGYTSINYDLIYGLPLQTLDGLIDTMTKVSALKPDRIAYYSYAHVPWLKPGQRMFTELDLPAPELKAQLRETGREILTGFGYQEIGMDHFALPGDQLLVAEQNGSLHRNFMGYTHQHTQLLVGLGVSSISDAWYAFAQNVKTVEEYLKLIESGELPVFKGHLLTGEDQILRRHILNVMCAGKTTWNYHTTPFEALFESIERLQDAEIDGLIELDASHLRVTELGRHFLRNICMAFDARLWANKRDTQQFSMAV